jgi:hypothetical protein
LVDQVEESLAHIAKNAHWSLKLYLLISSLTSPTAFAAVWELQQQQQIQKSLSQ